MVWSWLHNHKSTFCRCLSLPGKRVAVTFVTGLGICSMASILLGTSFLLVPDSSLTKYLTSVLRYYNLSLSILWPFSARCFSSFSESSWHCCWLGLQTSRMSTYCKTVFSRSRDERSSFTTLLKMLRLSHYPWGSLVYVYCWPWNIKVNRCVLSGCNGMLKNAEHRSMTM